ncbi:4051_t:CDS:2 [Ambispora gerdemannii]|uniref:4051_t:CDS:1 n=1 Tax=Ambispora gerdemannii TaxID=144530 RepID=A0A9N8ZTV2_9GLOM|nr:4051_t:CDS:2 [Ambispora gerdemannii]
MCSQPITVQEFLDALVGSRAFEKLKSLLDEQANDNNSVILHNTILCKCNQKGTGLIIPIVMIQDDKIPVTENNVSFISIQVRNREADDQPTDNYYQLKNEQQESEPTAHYIGIDSSIIYPLPYLGIYISLGVTFEDERMGHLSIYELSKSVYSCLKNKDSAIELLLHKLLISCVDPVEKEDGKLWDGHEANDEWI